MKRILSLLLLFASLVLTFCCDSAGGSSELSRRKAAQLINQYPGFASTQRISLQETGLIRIGTGQEAGVVERLWTIQVGTFGVRNRVLTDKGQKVFTTDWKLATRAKREVVEITGISDAPMVQNIKIAEFRWRYVDLPEVVARYTGQGNSPHDGKAEFQLYDDGWRVKAVQTFETGRQPFVWTRTLEEEADRQYRAAQEAEKAKLERERIAKTPTRTIGTYKLSCHWSGQQNELTITDTSVRVNGWNHPQVETIGYWNPFSIRNPDEWGPSGCSYLEFDAPLGAQFASPWGWELRFFGEAADRAVLQRAHDQIVQAQKEWQQKYPDIH